MKSTKGIGKKILSFVSAVAISVSLLSGMSGETMMTVQAATKTVTAAEITEDMGLGWNLGNSLDATGRGSSNTITDFETYWGNPVVTQSLIDTVKAKGFQTVRIPVSWYEHISYNNGNYTIDQKWLARVKEVVDYAYNEDLYVILNIHHEEWINRSDFEYSYSAMSKQLKKVWKQIATYFADYDQRLIFEGMNEPRAKGTSYEWVGNNACYEVVNQLNADFVNTVRSVSSPYQKTRILMIPGYAASSSTDVFSHIEVPDDDYIAVSIHAYSPYDFTMGSGDHWNFSSSYAAALDTMFGDIRTYFINKGIPVVIGEFSASNYNNTSARVDWAKYYLTWTKKLGIPCVLWDNNANTNGSDSSEAHGYLNRSTLKWYSGSEQVVNTMFSVLNDSSVVWGSAALGNQSISHASVDSVASKYVITSSASFISGYCVGSYAISSDQLASDREIAVVYTGTSQPKIALANASWGNWTEVSPYDIDQTKGIAYFSYDDIKKAWGNSTSSIKYIYVCGTGLTMKKVVSIPEATITTGNSGSSSSGSTDETTSGGNSSSEDTSSGSTSGGSSSSENTSSGSTTGGSSSSEDTSGGSTTGDSGSNAGDSTTTNVIPVTLKGCNLDLSKFSGIGSLNLYMWWNSEGATITNVCVVVE